MKGAASVDESAITGESAPRENGGYRSAVTGSTTVLSDWIIVKITSEAKKLFRQNDCYGRRRARKKHQMKLPCKINRYCLNRKQLLMTRGSLTTFSITNDVAKYFAIIPALFVGLYSEPFALNIMNLHSSQSAVLSAIIYNALIIIALIPSALKGVKYRVLETFF